VLDRRSSSALRWAWPVTPSTGVHTSAFRILPIRVWNYKHQYRKQHKIVLSISRPETTRLGTTREQPIRACYPFTARQAPWRLLDDQGVRPLRAEYPRLLTFFRARWEALDSSCTSLARTLSAPTVNAPGEQDAVIPSTTM